MSDAAMARLRRVARVRRTAWLGGAAVAMALALGACATRTLPPAPASPAFPDYLYPTPPPGAAPELATRIERGWRYLQVRDFRNAEREFQGALGQQPGFYPAQAGLGWVQLARQDAEDAAGRFDRALAGEAAYVPALVGRGSALLALGRDGEALASFEAALAADPSLTAVRSRVDVLQFRAMQDNLTRAQAAQQAGRWDEARAAYQRAIAGSPESAFLYRELAAVERSAGDAAAARDHYRRATELDPMDAAAFAGLGAVLEGQEDYAAAVEAYEKARAIDLSAVADETLETARERAVLARLPEGYRNIGTAPVVTRGQLAALLGVQLEPLLASAPTRQVVMTDLRGHWAQQWILAVVRAGVMDPLPNYQFQPAAQVRRGDLAQVVSRALALIASRRPSAAATWRNARLQVADVPPGHLSYPAVSQAVAAGVLSLGEGGQFGLLRPVSGAEALDAVARLKALARP
ncbi:MAG: tetratricopeptide repeat protein [Vicinamibacterales bacterium]